MQRQISKLSDKVGLADTSFGMEGRNWSSHVSCGVEHSNIENIVTETAKQFTVKEVSADKGYSGRGSYRAVDAVGGVAYIPFLKQATGLGRGKGFDPLWNRMHAYYHFQRADFEAHYHKRSNAESTFSMVKAKFGGSIRAKTPTAQVNEVLLKILCHNIVVLISSMYELGIEPIFRAERADARQEVA